MATALKETEHLATDRLFDAGSKTLEAAIAATWKTLAVRGNAGCLLCGGTVVRTDEGVGCCTACGSALE